MSTINLEEIQAEYVAFPQMVKTLILGTATPDNTPHVSYTPFVMTAEHHIYLYTSRLAEHTQNMERGGQISVLLIEDEGSADQLFARKRLSYTCDVAVVARGTEEFTAASDLMLERFGQFHKMLLGFKDFMMFRLTPTAGSFVVGFGRAFTVSGNNLSQLEHVIR